MPKFKPVYRLGRHDICQVRDDNGEILGLGLYCMSKNHHDTVSVNIGEFKIALDLDIVGVLFKAKDLQIYLPVEEAKRRIEESEQKDDYKVVHLRDAQAEIPFEF